MTLRRLAPSIGGTLLTALLVFNSHIAAQTLTTLHSFTGGPNDGWGPETGVVIGAGGVLYGNTCCGGTTEQGTAFSLTPPASPGGLWTENVYSFPNTEAGNSYFGTLAISIGSNVLIGNNTESGSSVGGIVFSLHPPASPGDSWAEKLLYEFTDYPSEGQNPNSVAISAGGVLYGTTQRGGTNSCEFDTTCGTVFSLTPPASPGGVWTETVLHNFAGYPSDGSEPLANVAIGSGVLYGRTMLGGTNNGGAVFSLTPPSFPGGAWTETVLYNFTNVLYGCGPGQIIVGSRGVLYGLTSGYGTFDDSVFSLTPPASPGGAWKQTVLHTFAGGPSDGLYPNSLAFGSGGVLYGTTQSGGTADAGTLFSLTPPSSGGGSWTETVLYSFTGGSDGDDPTSVVMGSGGVLYGTTNGGISNYGTVFSFTP